MESGDEGGKGGEQANRSTALIPLCQDPGGVARFAADGDQVRVGGDPGERGGARRLLPHVRVSPTSHPTLAIKVTSPYGNTLHESGNATVGQFAFTTKEAGNYLACFWMDSAEKESGVSLNLDWKIGIATKDWDAIAKKEKIEGVELELRKLEVAVESIHQNMIYLKAREAEMREVSEKTNGRVAWFSILSLSVCIAVSVLQVWHLQGYFAKKKLI